MKNKISIYKEDFLTLVGDGAIASTKTADGRLIPVLILDTRIKKDLEYLVKMHGQSEAGDVTSAWAVKRFNNDFVNLVLNFKNPVELTVAISFEVSKHYALIEGILISRALYIQPGAPGDRIRHNINAPKLLVEIPARTKFDKWDGIFNKVIAKKLKKNGIARGYLRDAVSEKKALIRDVWGSRLK